MQQMRRRTLCCVTTQMRSISWVRVIHLGESHFCSTLTGWYLKRHLTLLVLTFWYAPWNTPLQYSSLFTTGNEKLWNMWKSCPHGRAGTRGASQMRTPPLGRWGDARAGACMDSFSTNLRTQPPQHTKPRVFQSARLSTAQSGQLSGPTFEVTFCIASGWMIGEKNITVINIASMIWLLYLTKSFHHSTFH